MRPIRVPNDEAWKDLEQTLGLDERTSQALREYVSWIVNAIQADVRQTDKQPDRKVRSRELRAVIKSFDTLAKTMQSPLFTARSTEFALVDQVAPLLSMEAYERLVGGLSPWYVTPREIEGHGPTRGPGDYLNARVFEAATRLERMNIARNRGPALFESLLAELRDPFDRLSRLEQSRKGGRPRDHRRDFVIAELARITARPTGSPAGPFVRLCEAVLIAIGLPETGVDKTVQSFLKRRKKPEPALRRGYLLLDPASGVPIAEFAPTAETPTVIGRSILVPLDTPEAEGPLGSDSSKPPHLFG